jgi:aryl-alcohol dehydrogenase-like predicted oxidoreductase
MTTTALNAADSGTFTIGGDLPVHRLGFGAMRITGDGVWGPPRDHDEAIAVLRRSVELGINLIDTAESYGPYVSEELIAEALHPYPKGLVIATKIGLDRTGPNQWRIERIDLYQLHRIDPNVPEEEQFGTLREFQTEGKVRHLGLSEVTVEQIERARKYFEVTTVQNRYNLADREWESVVDYCERENIGFIPWFPLATGKLADNSNAPLARIAKAHGAAPSQIALAWLLRRAKVMLPIPGTSKVKHLEENVAGASIELTEEEFGSL